MIGVLIAIGSNGDYMSRGTFKGISGSRSKGLFRGILRGRFMSRFRSQSRVGLRIYLGACRGIGLRGYPSERFRQFTYFR